MDILSEEFAQRASTAWNRAREEALSASCPPVALPETRAHSGDYCRSERLRETRAWSGRQHGSVRRTVINWRLPTMERASKVIRKLGLSGEIITPERMALAVWAEAVGKNIAPYTRPVKLVRTRL